jgi:MATE family multidrug resistance protein
VTLIVIASLLLLVPVNAAFMHGWWLMPALGGAGVGLANSVVAWVSTLLLWVLLCVHPYFKHLSLTTLWPKWQWAQSKSILLLGLPIGLAIFFEASLFCFAAPIIAPLGTVPLASHQIALSVTSQLFMVPIALAMATTLLVGKLYGLGQYSSIVNVRNIVNGLAIWMALLMMVLLWLGNSLLVKAYTTDVTLQKIASNILLFAVAYQVFDALQVVAAGVLRGLQRPRYAMWATIVVYWGVGLPLGIVLTHYSSLGVYGFWLAVVVALLLAAVLLQRELARELRRLPAS